MTLPRPGLIAGIAGIALALAALAAIAQHQHDPGKQHGSHAASGHQLAPDSRLLVRFPDAMRAHTLGNMREHLQALADIQAALASESYDQASGIAEQRLGMTSLTSHGAHESSKYMPKGMQEIGSQMHRSASQFAVEVSNSAVTRDTRPALAALARTTQACVACHAAYRLQ